MLELREIVSASTRLAGCMIPRAMFSDVSCEECVDALVLAGHRVVRRTTQAVVLERGLRTVLVPRKALLEPHVLDSILVQANVPWRRVAELLGEVPTRPDLVSV
jgi:hypothetical protein